MFGDDYGWTGVKKAVQEFAAEYDRKFQQIAAEHNHKLMQREVFCCNEKHLLLSSSVPISLNVPNTSNVTISSNVQRLSVIFNSSHEGPHFIKGPLSVSPLVMKYFQAHSASIYVQVSTLWDYGDSASWYVHVLLAVSVLSPGGRTWFMVWFNQDVHQGNNAFHWFQMLCGNGCNNDCRLVQHSFCDWIKMHVL